MSLFHWKGRDCLNLEEVVRYTQIRSDQSGAPSDDLDAQIFGCLRCAKLQGSICPVFVTVTRSFDGPSF